MSATYAKPTESELEILQELWSLGPATVREVNDRLSEKKDVGYTTTLKLMQIMTDKGLVSRDTSRRQHIYKAVIKEDEVQKNMLKRMVKSAFHGSVSSLVMQALGNHNASQEELDEIKALIEHIESNQK